MFKFFKKHPPKEGEGRERLKKELFCYKKDIPARRKRQYRPYSPTQLKNAYMEVVEKGCSVYKAAKMYSVPEQTLRDRTKGITSPECLSSGPGPLLSQEEEARLVSHLKLMASVGYGYTRSQVISLGTEYAITLNKRTKQDSSLSLQWFYSFMGRWPELKLRRPRTLTQLRATATSEESVEKYFSQLGQVLDKYQLYSSPERIYNVDEKGINLTHSSPQVVGSSSEVPIEITPEKSATVTILGCGNALGQKIPPFFIFPGARMRDDLLEGGSVGTSGTVSDSGWSNSEIFQHWLTEHFTRYANVGGEKKVLLLYDGHRSHITPTLIDFAVSSGIILFVLPPHTSHVLQPMDVGCFGPFTKIFSAECRKWQRFNSGTVNRYSVCSLACKSYELSLSSMNLQSSFRKCGIFPFDPTAIDRSFLKPSTFAKEQNTTQSAESDVAGASTDFFTDHLPVVTIKKAKPRRSIHKIVGGQAITEPIIASQVAEYISYSKKPTSKHKETSMAGNTRQKKKKSIAGKTTQTSSRQLPSSTTLKHRRLSPQTSGPSGVDKLLISDNSDSDMSARGSDTEDDKCCVCNKFQPDELRRSPNLKVVDWGQCTIYDCGHWVHLKYCCTETVLRVDDEFHCPCSHQEE